MINGTKHQLKSNMVLTTLGPDHCDLHILEHPSEDKQTELEEIGPRDVVKTEGSDDSMSVDEDMEVIYEEDNDVKDFVQDPLKYESITFQCTLCLEEFVHELAYMQHTCVHLQSIDGDSESATSQVCEPHTAVSSSSSHSSLITENKQADPSPSAHAAHTSVAPASATFASSIENKVHTNKEADAEQKVKQELKTNKYGIQDTSVDSKIFTKCEVRLCDIIKIIEVPRRDNSLTNTGESVRCCNVQNEVPTTEYIEPVTNSSSRVKVTVSKTVQSVTDNINIQCINSSQYSSHTAQSSLICDICQKNYYCKSLLVKHMKTHSEVRPFTCKICQHKCKWESHLAEHMRIHTGEKPYSCKICKSKFSVKSTLNRHIIIHTGDKPFTCKICNRKFTEKGNLVTHMRTHTGEKPYSCALCEYKCSVKSNLKQHIIIHTGEKPFTCKICSSKFPQKVTLVTHMRTHTDEKPYSCALCEYKCSVKSNLNSHMITHTGEKPFTCNMCNSKFARKVTLVTHMRTHTGVKPYSCALCEYKCSVKSTLKQHIIIHTGEKPFICKICNSKFPRMGNLVRHMRTHTGEKPYSCALCEYKCSVKSSLNRHMKTHTGEK